MDDNPKPTRRSVLKAAALFAGAALTANRFSIKDALAQQKASKQSMKYQDKPNGSQECDNCLQFEPPNRCKVVECDISPKGYCIAWVKKP